jgi:hypothetical protein
LKKLLPRDQLLIMSRRIDWRFLLPVPTLNRVGIVGQPDKALHLALSHFAETVQFIRSDTQPEQLFDVIIFLKPSPKDISVHLNRLAPNGYVYAELPTFRRFSTMRGIAKKIARYESALHNAGLSNVDFYWHRPNFYNCKEIVPLQQKPALSFALAKGHSGIKGAAENTAAHIFRFTGFYPPIIRHISLVAGANGEAAQ